MCTILNSIASTPEPYHVPMANGNDQNQLDKKTVARVAKEMGEPRMTKSVRKALETPVTADRKFRPDECVYNRTTKEYGIVRGVYEKDGVTMYKVWLPPMPYSLRWGHFVSDWAEGVLEFSDKILTKSARA
jgi:hypothetical protein